MNRKTRQQAADAAQYVFEIFATDTNEVANHLGVSQSIARARLDAAAKAGLVDADLQETEGGLVNKGERVGKHYVWQSVDGSIDDTSPAEYAAKVYAALGVWPTGHAPKTGPSEQDVAAAVDQLQKELESPEFAAALASTETVQEDAMNEKTETPKKAPAKKKAAPKKAAAPKAPAVLAAKDAAKLKAAGHLKADLAARVGEEAGDAAPGYIVRWPKASYDLLLKTDAAPADAPKWLVRCNEHGTTLAVSGAKEGDQKGRAAERQVWCPACKKAAAAKAKAAKK